MLDGTVRDARPAGLIHRHPDHNMESREAGERLGPSGALPGNTDQAKGINGLRAVIQRVRSAIEWSRASPPVTTGGVSTVLIDHAHVRAKAAVPGTHRVHETGEALINFGWTRGAPHCERPQAGVVHRPTIQAQYLAGAQPGQQLVGDRSETGSGRSSRGIRRAHSEMTPGAWRAKRQRARRSSP